MSTDHHTDILAALNVLCNVSEEALQPHRSEALLAFQKLRVFVDVHHIFPTPRDIGNLHSPSPDGHDLSLSRTNDQDFTLSSPNSHDSSIFFLDNRDSTGSPLHTHGCSPPPTDLTLKLVQALDKGSALISQYLTKATFEAIKGVSVWINEDPRVIDLQIGGHRSSQDTKFRKGLSQRSLANEYNQWEINTHGVSRIRELVQDVSKSTERTDGHITEYLDVNTQFKDQRTTRTGIEHGIKLLVFEQLYGNGAISGILFLQYSCFRRVKFGDLDRLKDLMLGSAWIPELVKRLTWFNDCQCQYNAQCRALLQTYGKRQPYSSEPSRKRPRMDDEVNLSFQSDDSPTAQLPQRSSAIASTTSLEASTNTTAENVSSRQQHHHTKSNINHEPIAGRGDSYDHVNSTAMVSESQSFNPSDSCVSSTAQFGLNTECSGGNQLSTDTSNEVGEAQTARDSAVSTTPPLDGMIAEDNEPPGASISSDSSEFSEGFPSNDIIEYSTTESMDPRMVEALNNATNYSDVAGYNTMESIDPRMVDALNNATNYSDVAGYSTMESMDPWMVDALNNAANYSDPQVVVALNYSDNVPGYIWTV